MDNPLIIAYHLIWTGYGRWLPNDPRGSGSATIAGDVIAELGDLHHGRRPVQPQGRVIREFYQTASRVLKHPLLKFDAAARDAVGAAFGDVIRRERYTCYACAVMPDHVHLLIRKHKHAAEEMADRLKTESRLRLCNSGLRNNDHPTWTGGCVWHVFLDDPDDIWRTIPYIENNPLPLGLPIQRWPFVQPYDNWPLHPGHSSNSPYARGLKAVGRYR
jgi:REP element-mobilizing transposase RayT